MSDAESTRVADVSFSGLVLGFSSAALYYLGQTKLEGALIEEKNTALAQHNVDIIALLKAKTVNNLTPEEAEMLDSVLSDLNARLQKESSATT